MRRLLLLAVLVAGCNANDPTAVCLRRDAISGICLDRGVPSPTPVPFNGCPFLVGVEPLQVQGAYFVKAIPPGPFTVVVGATIYGAPDEGIVVYGTPGQVVSACRSCGCALPVPLP